MPEKLIQNVKWSNKIRKQFAKLMSLGLFTFDTSYMIWWTTYVSSNVLTKFRSILFYLNILMKKEAASVKNEHDSWKNNRVIAQILFLIYVYVSLPNLRWQFAICGVSQIHEHARTHPYVTTWSVSGDYIYPASLTKSKLCLLIWTLPFSSVPL